MIDPRLGTGAAAYRLALCLYLLLMWTGCGSTAPKLDYVERIRLQSRTLQAPYADVFEASVLALRDLDYEIDLIDGRAGLLTGVKRSEYEIAKIHEPDDGGLPTWAWIAGAALIVVVIAVVAVVSVVGGDGEDDGEGTSTEEAESDDSEDNETRSVVVSEKDRSQFAGSSGVRDPGGNVPDKGQTMAGASVDSTEAITESGVRAPGGNATNRTPAVAGNTEKSGMDPNYRKPLVSTGDLPPKLGGKTRIRVDTPYRIKRREAVETDDYEAWYYQGAQAVLDMILAPDPQSQSDWYHYRMTVNIEDQSDSMTSTRLEIQGSKLQGADLKRSGEVLDPHLYQEYFSIMSRYLDIRRKAAVTGTDNRY